MLLLLDQKLLWCDGCVIFNGIGEVQASVGKYDHGEVQVRLADHRGWTENMHQGYVHALLVRRTFLQIHSMSQVSQKKVKQSDEAKKQ